MLAPALTILLSSFLLFLVQPILAKQILPWFGGSAAVWTVCLVFFQTVLVLGYAYAHLLTRQRGSRQFVVHIALLLISCLALPIIPGSYWQQDRGTEPALKILSLLAVTVGLPYLLLSSTGPLLQRWLSQATHSREQPSIYRLFALSNFGSLVGLLCYPFVVEPLATAHVQAWAWSSAYALFVVCSISYAWKRRLVSVTTSSQPPDEHSAEAAPSRGRYAYWAVCAALGSALLLSGTNHITQNVAAVPLLWIVPLGVYLLSFVVCFEGRSGLGWYERRVWVTPTLLATAAMAWTLFANGGNISAYVALPVFVAGIFLGCVVCHGELARTKPIPEYLTGFYLTLAAGGALGGMLVGLVAPRVFKGYWEMPLALIALAVLCLYCAIEESRQSASRSWSANVVVAILVTGLILLLLGQLPSALDPYALPWARIVQGDGRWGCVALLILAAPLLQRYRLWRAAAFTALTCTLTFGWVYYTRLSTGTEYWARNFYGALRVIELPYAASKVRKLMHGTILHGSQVMQPPQRAVPTTYYGESSGIGRTLACEHRMSGALRIGSVGLGAGTLATYGMPGDVFRVYEINPAVLDIARNQFAYLSDSKAQVEPVLGDARISLEREVARGAFEDPQQRYDVLSLDAFSGDAIPLHLLTREAFATYTRVIKPDGVIAFHVSNRFLDLPPVVGQIARDAGFQAVLIEDHPVWTHLTWGLTEASYWVLVTRNSAFLRQPDIATHSVPLAPRTGLREWTDQFTNLLQVLK